MFGGIRTVEKLLESVMSKEFKEKEYNANTKRYQMLYLGDKDFGKTFKELDRLKRRKVEDELKKQKEEKRMRKEQNQEAVFEVDDLKPDKEEIFLRQLPGLHTIYRKNRAILKARSQVPGYDPRKITSYL